MITFNYLMAQALIVLNAKLKKENTARRIGGLFRDLLLFLQNLVLGMIFKGELANEAAIKSIANPQKGDTYRAVDTGHYWCYDGSKWNDIGEIIPGDVITSSRLSKVLGTSSTVAPSEIAVGNAIISMLHPFSSTNNDRTQVIKVQQCISDILIIGTKDDDYNYVLKVLYNKNTGSQIQINKIHKTTQAETVIINDYIDSKRTGVQVLEGATASNSEYTIFVVIDWDLVFQFAFTGNLDLYFDDSVFSKNLPYLNYQNKADKTDITTIDANLANHEYQLYKPFNKSLLDTDTLNKINSVLLGIRIIGTPEADYNYALRVLYNSNSGSQIQINKIHKTTQVETVIINDWVGTKRTGVQILEGVTANNSEYTALAVIDSDKLYNTTIPNGYYYFNTDQVFVNDIGTFNSAMIKRIIRYLGKSSLHIGDSQTILGDVLWKELQRLLGLSSYKIHALGGIGLPQMVDGFTNGQGTLAPLSVNDVKDKDIITIWGGYNNRTTPYGEKGDMYNPSNPQNATIRGYVNYVINRVYDLLKEANNLQCKVLFITPHAAGAYNWNEADGYTEFGGEGMSLQNMAKVMEDECNNIGVPCLNLFNDGGINKYNWSLFQKSATADNTDFTLIGEVEYEADLASLSGNEKDVVKVRKFKNGKDEQGNDVYIEKWDNTYIHNGTQWVRYDKYPPYTPFPYKNDQLHVGEEGYKKQLAGVINGRFIQM